MENVKRIKWLDVARSLAIISITCNHAVNRSFSTEVGQYAEFLKLPFAYTVLKAVIYAFSRIGVPLFLMITGALMLNKDYEKEGTIGRFVKHNWLQLFITTEIWHIILFIYMQISPDSALRTDGVIACLISFVKTLLFIDPTTFGSMWYMHMILCAYLLVPVFAIALKRIKASYFIIPIAIVAISGLILPDVNGTLHVLGSGKTVSFALSAANVFSIFAAFMLFGYFVTQKDLLKKFKTPIIVLLMLLSFAAFCAFQIWCYSKEPDFVVAEGYRSIFCFVPALFLFELLRRLNYGERFASAATFLSRIAFGIYFVHICIMQGLTEIWGRIFPSVNYLPKFLLLEVVSFIGSIVVILVLGKIKWCRKNLFVIK
ncbi:MAG: acyltransferase [Clostridia bacterium]|nr:acyltransferase [Clostridia bacterium]